MLLTVTLNPSVDISYHLEKFNLNDVNRVTKVKKTAGGKGLNVARVAQLLGVDVLSTGVLGGSLGSFIEQQLDKDHIHHSFLHTKEEARNCIAILHEQMQTEILESGPSLTKDDQAKFLNHFETLLQDVSVVTISGSIVKGFSEYVYVQIIERANHKNIPVLLDTSGRILEVSLMNKHALPYLIKPNLSELSQLVYQRLSNNPSDLKEALRDKLFEGIPWIVVSLGAEGAFAKHHDAFYQMSIPKITVQNPVGSGDATVAGLAKALEAGKDDETTLQYGMAAGLLNAMEKQTGYVDAAKFQHYIQLINVQQI